jgi:hypothetical protein
MWRGCDSGGGCWGVDTESDSTLVGYTRVDMAVVDSEGGKIWKCRTGMGAVGRQGNGIVHGRGCC